MNRDAAAETGSGFTSGAGTGSASASDTGAGSRVLPFGDRALLAEYPSLDATMAAYRMLAANPPAGVTELVPAARSILLRIDPSRLSLGAAEDWLRRLGAGRSPRARPADSRPATPAIDIPVRYDGPDLAESAALLGLTPAELVARHADAVWTCAFIGFAPGFAYLTPDRFPGPVPRRATSRERVPAGSVGLAGEFGGVYPRESPGGWQLIGSTDALLWDEARADPALLPPGTVVRFRAVP